MRKQCRCCGGTYDDVQPDGLQYFHVCPPLSLAELAKAVEDGRVVLSGKETVEDAHAARVYLRASGRNENVARRASSAPAAPIVAEGKGTVDVEAVPSSAAAVVVPD